MWTEARQRGLGLPALARWMAAAPARLTGLADRGAIAPGLRADLCAFAPDATFTVDPARLRHRHPVTPYPAVTCTARSAGSGWPAVRPGRSR